MSTAPVNKHDIGGVHEAPDPELERLYEEYSRLVYRAAFHITPSRQDAEDVLQSVFLNGELGGGPSGGGNRGGGGPRELRQCNSNFSKILKTNSALY